MVVLISDLGQLSPAFMLPLKVEPTVKVPSNTLIFMPSEILQTQKKKKKKKKTPSRESNVQAVMDVVFSTRIEFNINVKQNSCLFHFT
jgi:hypothetical protein